MRSVKNARRNRKLSTWKNRPKRKNNARKKANKAKQWQRNSGRERRQILETEGKREEGQHKEKKRIRTEKEEEETMRRKASAKDCGNGNDEKCVTAEALKNIQVNQKHEKEKSVGRKGENGQRKETGKTEKEKGKKETIEMEKKENCDELANLDEKKEERKEEEKQQQKKRGEEKGQTKHLMENGIGGEKGKGAAEKERNTDQKTKRAGGYGGGDTVETDQRQTQQQNGVNVTTQFARDLHKLANSVDEIQRMATPLNPIKIEPLRLERITRRTTERKPREHKLLETDIQYCEHMISKHGNDYEAMSRDPTNAVGDAPTAIQRKLRIYRDFIKHQQQNEASA
ncbi:hypothetical protein niasHT_037086 [Heterodera trifolii]|uniref:Nucleolar protein 16 n=1 Tax=Heterodera trifolii TaxID=157864 RepID=A0ABD2J0A8_9BILA